MNILTVFAGITNILSISNLTEIDMDAETNTDTYLDTAQIIRKYGYPAEAHTMRTTDGYLLTVHRIPEGKHPRLDGFMGRKPPVLLQHGLLGSSADFVLMASKTSLAFLLADLGYDVWLGNVRGNKYNRAHSSLFPDSNKFWNFTWHESAVYDVPAEIDYICNHTKQEKIVYVGFSMGTTLYFALMSTLPQYKERIHVSLLMAPVAYVKNIKSILLRFLAKLSDTFKELIEYMEYGEFMPNTKLFKILTKIFCERNDLERRLCMNAIFLIAGSDPDEFDKSLLPVLLNNFPNGYSAKGVNHYAQLVKSGKFRQYDYGREGNMLQYGSPVPPDYNLSLIQTPMYFYQAKNDPLATAPDVKHLAKQLPTLKKVEIVEDQNFTHLDFMLSIDAKSLIYDVLIKDLTNFMNKQTTFIKYSLSRMAPQYLSL